MLAINDDTFANVIRTAEYFIEKNSTASAEPVSTEVIDAAVRKAVRQLLEDSPPEEQALYVEEATRRVQAGRRVTIADPSVLIEGPQLDWYIGDRRRTRPLWDRYKRLLANEETFDPTTLASVDRCSDRIVEQLGDPQSTLAFDKRGLVVGQVQSGKTTSYAAVINKAIDTGYRVIVVLTGVHETLRVQTQKRIEESVRGLATETGKAGGPDKGTPLRLAQIQPIADPPHMFTTRAVGGDFSVTAAKYAIPVTGTHMFVVKKNAFILKELVGHFQKPVYTKQHNSVTGATEISGRALLIIDDEADNASVDVNRPDPADKDHDPTAINRAIRRLLIQFQQRAYVGYTATPYANILIHKDNETTGVGPDLFPEDFIVMLPAPSSYVGPTTFFGGTTVAPTPGDRNAQPPLLRYVKDCGLSVPSPTDWMPRGHKKTHVLPTVNGVSGIPASLESAVLSYTIATSVRQLRGWGRSHNTMLVHVSRFKQVQQLVRQALDLFVYKLKGALSDDGCDPELLGRLQLLYEKDFVPTSAASPDNEPGYMPPFTEVKARAREMLDSVKVWTVNSEAETDLDYDEYPDGLKVICVGGDKLSRGLTLHGLTVSYFLRATRMYDTLMQMGRWFGYRPGYKDLCRLYLTDELARWYQHVVRADEELRGEFLTLEDERRKPADYGLRVRSHPSLLVTAKAKMSSAQELSLNFGGHVTQTINFFRDPKMLAANATATAKFLSGISRYADTGEGLVRRDPTTGARGGSQPLPGYLYTGVPVQEVRAFLRTFRFHPDANTVGAPQLLEFLDRLAASRVDTTWSVVVASGGRPGAGAGTPVSLAPGVAVIPVARATKPPAPVKWTEDVRAAPIVLGVLASPTDLVADLRESEVNRLRELPAGRTKVDPVEGEHAARSRACKARDPDHCLLVLYAVQPTAVLPVEGDAPQLPGAPKVKPTKVELAPGSAPPIGLALALPANKQMPAVSYVVNSVAIDELEAEFASDDQ